MANIYCGKCRQKIKSTFAFCPFCGATIEEARSKEKNCRKNTKLKIKTKKVFGFERFPIGTKKEDLITIPEEAETVREIFRLSVDENIGMVKTIDELYKRGIKTSKKAEKWETSTLSELMCNEIYSGTIVSPEVFETARRLRKERVGGAIPGRTALNPFRGILKCKDCGNYIHLHRSNGYLSMGCRAKYCTNSWIAFEKVEKVILEKLREISIQSGNRQLQNAIGNYDNMSVEEKNLELKKYVEKITYYRENRKSDFEIEIFLKE